MLAARGVRKMRAKRKVPRDHDLLGRLIKISEPTSSALDTLSEALGITLYEHDDSNAGMVSAEPWLDAITLNDDRAGIG